MKNDFLKELENIINGEKEDRQKSMMNIMDNNFMSLEEKMNLYFQPLREATASVEKEMTDYQNGLELSLVKLIKSKKGATNEKELRNIDDQILREYNFLKQMLFYDYYEEFFPNISKEELEKRRIEEEEELLEELRKQKRVGMI